MPSCKTIFSRAIVFYLIVGAVLFYTIDRKKVSDHAWPKTLSRLRVEYSYLISVVNGAEPELVKFIDGKRYFNAVLRLAGASSGVELFLGMSSYYMGDRVAARDHFLRVKNREPGFFWPYYNLALFAYEDKDYPAMEAYCQQAFLSPTDKSVLYMKTRPVYQPLFVENGFTSEMLARNMDVARLMLLQLLMKVKSNSSPLKGERLPVRVF